MEVATKKQISLSLDEDLIKDLKEIQQKGVNISGVVNNHLRGVIKKVRKAVEEGVFK